MDVKEIIEKVEGMLGDEAFKKALASDPVKAIEKATGIKVTEAQLKAVLEAVKDKVDIKDVESLVKLAQGAVGGEAKESIVKEVEEKVEGLLGGLLGKK